MEGADWFGFFAKINSIFTNSALPRDCCSGVSMRAQESSDSAVIDSRYKPVWQRECLSRSRRPCSPLSRSGALFAEDSSCWYYSRSFVLFVVQMFGTWTSEPDGFGFFDRINRISEFGTNRLDSLRRWGKRMIPFLPRKPEPFKD